MRSNRQLLAAVFVMLSALFLAGCQSVSDNPMNAASTDEPKGIWQKLTAAKTVTIPQGTELQIRLLDAVGSAQDRSGQTFQATLDQPILVNGSVAVPRGANVTGRVLTARPSGHLRTPAELIITLTALQVGGKNFGIATSDQSWRGRSHKKRDAEWIGGLAGGGALIGALAGHGKGAAIGAATGAGAGTAAAYATGKKDIFLPSETRLRFVLRRPVTITKA